MNSRAKKVKQKSVGKQKLLISILIIFIGFYIGMVIIALFGYNPFSLITATWKGNFSSTKEFGNFLSVLTWMIFIGLSALVAFRAQIFNIGIFAQMVGGGLCGYLFAALANTSGRYGFIFSLLIPVFVGMLIALFIAFLKNNFRINAVVSSIMLNWIVFWVYRYFRNPINAPYLFNGGSTPIDILPQNSLRFDWLTNVFPDSSINIGIFLVIIIVPLIWFLYSKTSFGIKQGIISNSEDISLYAGINYKREVYKAMALSGALAGLAGATFYLGTNQSIPAVGNDLPLEPFNGITIALIGFNNPLGVFSAAIFISLFENAKIYLNVYSNQHIIDLVMGIIILLISGANYILIYSPQTKFINWINSKMKFKEKETLPPKTQEASLTQDIEKNLKKEKSFYKTKALEDAKRSKTAYHQQYLKMKQDQKNSKKKKRFERSEDFKNE